MTAPRSLLFTMGLLMNPFSLTAVAIAVVLYASVAPTAAESEPPQSSDAWRDAVVARGYHPDSATRAAVTALMDHPAFSKVTELLVFLGTPEAATLSLVTLTDSALLSLANGTQFRPVGYRAGVRALEEHGHFGRAYPAIRPELTLPSLALPASYTVLYVGTADSAGACINVGNTRILEVAGNVDATANSYSGADYLSAPGSITSDVLLRRDALGGALYVDGLQVDASSGAVSAAQSGSGATLCGPTAGLGRVATALLIGDSLTIEEALSLRTALLELAAASGWSATGRTVVAMGDSLVHEGSSPQWPALMEDLNPSIAAVNDGFSGSTVADVLARVPLVARFTADPSPLAVCLAGTNDLRAGSSAEATLAALTALRVALEAAGFACALCTIPPRTDPGWTPSMEAERVSLNASIRSTWPTAHVDVSTVLTAAGEGAFKSDGLHLSQAGRALVAQAVATHVLAQ